MRARWFAALKDLRPGGEVALDLDEGATARSAFLGLFPDLGGTQGVACARNGQTCAWDTPLEDGDDLVFLPPFGGG